MNDEIEFESRGESENWDRVPHALPAIAVLAGSALLVLLALAGPRLLPGQPLAVLLIGGAALGLLLWILGMAWSVRHASILWMAGSLVLLLAAGLGAGLIAHGQFQTRARADASSFAEMDLMPDGTPVIPPGMPDRGPISKAFYDASQANQAEKRALGDAMARARIGSLGNAYLLTQDSSLLGKCGSLEDLKTLIRTQDQARAGRRAGLLRAADSANLPDTLKQGLRALFAPDGAGADPMTAKQIAMVDETRALCTLLARRSWRSVMGYFGFASAGDKNQFDAIQSRRLRLAGDMARIEKASRDRMAAGQEQVRDALSRSIYSGG